MTGVRLPQFHELARYYDALNERKDYRRESNRLESIARRYVRSGRTSWLDVACGTGRHLEWLRSRHPVVGLDASHEMLRIARRRLPGVRLVRGDMRRFRLHRRFDVVSCLFGAIGHLRTEMEVRDTFASLGRHLHPGGMAIVEPWVDRSDWRSGGLYLRAYEGPALTVVRLASSSRSGRHWVIHWHFLVAEPGRGVRYVQETDRGLLLSRGRLVELMRQAGLEARFLDRGLTPGRGLLIGTRPGGAPRKGRGSGR